MRFRSVVRTMVIVGLVVVAWYSIRQFQNVGRNTWLSKVQIASQPGSDKAFVKRTLGEPGRVMTPKEVCAIHGFLPIAQPVQGAAKVYGYVHSIPPPYTVAYVFLDRSGKVLRVHIVVSP